MKRKQSEGMDTSMEVTQERKKRGERIIAKRETEEMRIGKKTKKGKKRRTLTDGRNFSAPAPHAMQYRPAPLLSPSPTTCSRQKESDAKPTGRLARRHCHLY